MTRKIRNWKEVKVDEVPVAPHRYTRTAEGVDDDPTAMKLSEWMKLQPYQPGDVVWVEVYTYDSKTKTSDHVVRRALVSHVFPDHDRHGYRRPRYRIQCETKGGYFAKVFTYTYPGYIQRGYNTKGFTD